MARTLGDAFVRIRPDMSGFGPQVASGVTSSERGVKSRLGGFAKTAGLVVGAGLAAGVASFTSKGVQLEAQFGKTMSVLQATTKAPQAEMRQLSALAMKMGADTAFSANDASKAMLELARGGMTAAQIRGGALAGTMTLAAAGELDMGTAANMTVKAMGQFNLKANQSSSVAAALAGAANASSASVGDMGFALSQAGLAANSVGFSLQETTGILAAFSNNGLEGSDAGTSLKTMLDRLVPSTKNQASALRELGILTGKDTNLFLKRNGEYKSAAQISELLRKGTENLSASESKRLITQAFGSDAQRAATILAKEGAAGINEMTKATSDQAAAQNMAQANMRGTAGTLEMMHGSIETAQLAWGRAIKPLTIFGATLVTHIANGAVPIIEDFGRISKRELANVDFTVVSDALKRVDLGAIFGSVKAAVTGIDWRGVGASLSSVGDSLRGIDGSGLRDAFGRGAADTVSVFSVVIGFLADHIDTLAKYMPFLITAFIAYKAAQATANVVALAHIPIMAANVVGNIALAASNRSLATQMMIANGVERRGMVTRALSSAGTMAAAVASRVARGAVLAWTAAQWLLNVALNANPISLVVIAIIGLVAIFVLAWKRSDTFKRIVSAAFDKVKDAAAAAWRWLKKNWPLLLAIITGPIGLATLFVIRHWDSIRNKFRDVKDWVLGTFRRAWGGLRDILAGPIRFARDTIQNIFGARGPVRTAFSNAVGGIQRIWGNLRDAVRDPIGFIVNTVFNKGIVPFVNRIPFIPGTLATIKGFDSGGWTGPGDKRQPAGVVHADEHVWTKDESNRFPGGHAGLERLRARVRQGLVKEGEGYATGGRVRMDGKWLSVIAARQIRLMEQLSGTNFRVMQGGYGGSHIAASGSSHNYPGVADISPASIRYETLARRVGFAAWARNIPGRSRVGSGAHIHAVSLLDPGDRGAPQVYGSWANHGNGLSGANNDPAPHPPWIANLSRLLGGIPLTNLGGGGGGGGYAGPTAADAREALNPAKWVRALQGMGGWGRGLAGTVQGVVGNLRDAVVDKIKSAVAAAGAAVKSYAGEVIGANGAKSFAQKALGDYGWSMVQWPALNALWEKESGWNPRADNPTSSAYGIPQALPGSKMASAGRDWRTNAATQIRWGLGYIKSTYGRPTAAWAHSQAHNWYDDGGEARGTGYMRKRIIAAERVLSPRQTDLHNRQTAALEAIAAGRGRNERLYLTITNWDTGEAYISRVADSRVAAHRSHDATLGRMRR